MFGAKRVSVYATDQSSYGNIAADRKSTIDVGKIDENGLLF